MIGMLKNSRNNLQLYQLINKISALKGIVTTRLSLESLYIY